MKTTLVIILILVSIAKDYGQNSKSSLNSFKDFKLGMPIEDLLKQHPEIVKDPTNNFCCYSFYSEIKSDYMDKYGISELTLSSGDKISLKLGIYKGKLAFIGLAYKDYQVFDEILNALQTKYGKYSNIEQNYYSDPLAGMNKTDMNVYWKNQNYILNLSHTSGVGLTHIIYADDLIQKEIKSKKSKESLKKIQ